MQEQNVNETESKLLDKTAKYQKGLFTNIANLVSDLGISQKAMIEGIPLSNKPIQNILSVIHKVGGKVQDPKFSSVTKMIHFLGINYS